MRPVLIASLSIALFSFVCSACTPEQLGLEAPEAAAEEEVTNTHEESASVAPRGDGTAIEYTLRFPDAQTHYFEAEAIFPASEDTLTLMMAVWTPGSYLVREYARHVEALSARATDGTELELTKVRKNRWTVACAGHDRVVLRYRVYAREMSVRTNFVDDEFAVLTPAATFFAIPTELGRPYDLKLEPRDDWAESVTSLARTGDHQYRATDYDELVDSPILLGNPALYAFEAGGAPHRFVNFGEAGMWNGARSAADVEAIARAHQQFWGVVPYDHYDFLNVLGQGRGGLEHKFSTLMMGNVFASRDAEAYRGWLGLVSHEFFHTWNVKRLRPAALGPFDYENETYTHSLWIAEGITSYYDDLLLRRAGLMDRETYLEIVSKNIERVQTTPGRLVQPLAMASFDAWIKYYRWDENSNNTAISYYRKGALVALLLDAKIQRLTRGQKSLDDLMRLAYERFSGERGFESAEFRALANEVAGASLDEFFAAAVDRTDELDFSDALAWYGLRFKPVEEDDDSEQDPDSLEHDPAFLGASIGDDAVVHEVRRDTPAFRAGLNVDDELLAIGEHRVTGGQLDDRLTRYRPGDEVELLISRRGRLRRLAVTFGEKPTESYVLELLPAPTAQQRGRLTQWLGAE